MARSPRSVTKRHRHNKWIKRAKGYRGRRSTAYKIAKEAVLTAGQHAFHDRRKNKTNFRSLWQIKINAAVRLYGLSYSKFIHAMRTANVTIDRKILSELAVKHPTTFKAIVEKVKG